MPSPIDILLDPISLFVLAMYAGLLLWEAAAPARLLPRVRRWWLKGALSFVAYFYLSTYLPILWDGALAEHRLLDLSALPIAAQVGLALVVYELAAYGYHRAAHRFEPLWLAAHQMHHSAERLDGAGAFWFHPVDMVAWSAVNSFALVFVVGLAPSAATALVLLLTFLAILQHLNVRTPRWLGYLVQRPESHSIHHARGIHTKNFADLPVMDLLFGTFDNPADFAPTQGFHDGASNRVAEMLAFKDVSEPRAPEPEPQRISVA